MRQGAAGAVWYRSRATLHRRRGGYVTLALLIGLVTGVPPGITGGRWLWLLRAE